MCVCVTDRHSTRSQSRSRRSKHKEGRGDGGLGGGGRGGHNRWNDGSVLGKEKKRPGKRTKRRRGRRSRTRSSTKTEMGWESVGRSVAAGPGQPGGPPPIGSGRGWDIVSYVLDSIAEWRRKKNIQKGQGKNVKDGEIGRGSQGQRGAECNNGSDAISIRIDDTNMSVQDEWRESCGTELLCRVVSLVQPAVNVPLLYCNVCSVLSRGHWLDGPSLKVLK